MSIEIPRAEGHPECTDKAAETNHRIANHLAMLSGLVRLESARLQNASAGFDAADLAMVLAGVEAKLQAVATLHRKLAQPEQGMYVDLGCYLADIVSTTVESLGDPGALRLIVEVEPDCRVRAGDALRIALIACEVVTNSIKYAHPSGIGGTLRLSCGRSGPHLVLQIEDDGVGLPDHIDPATDGNLGFRVIRSLAMEMDARMRFESDGIGLVFALEIPIAAAANGNALPAAEAMYGS